MNVPEPLEHVGAVGKLLAAWLGPNQFVLSPAQATLQFELNVGDAHFTGVLRSLGTPPVVADALEVLSSIADDRLPLLIVPYMGKVSAELCDKADVSWIDLSGNAKVSGKNVYIYVEGRPNNFRRPGRPINVFAPKSSRISRFLIERHPEAFLQSEIANATKLDAGYTSKIVRRLERQNLIIRSNKDRIRARDPDLLLDSWRAKYDFSKHTIVKGIIPARGSEQLVKMVADVLNRSSIEFAATGLVASWAMTHFARYRTSTFFIERELPSAILKELGFLEESSGANVWFVIPNDEGVFQGKGIYDGIMCVHPAQAYLDLQNHPERAEDAAISLRESLLKWNSDE